MTNSERMECSPSYGRDSRTTPKRGREGDYMAWTRPASRQSFPSEKKQGADILPLAEEKLAKQQSVPPGNGRFAVVG